MGEAVRQALHKRKVAQQTQQPKHPPGAPSAQSLAQADLPAQPLLYPIEEPTPNREPEAVGVPPLQPHGRPMLASRTFSGAHAGEDRRHQTTDSTDSQQTQLSVSLKSEGCRDRSGSKEPAASPSGLEAPQDRPGPLPHAHTACEGMIGTLSRGVESSPPPLPAIPCLSPASQHLQPDLLKPVTTDVTATACTASAPMTEVQHLACVQAKLAHESTSQVAVRPQLWQVRLVYQQAHQLILRMLLRQFGSAHVHPAFSTAEEGACL